MTLRISFITGIAVAALVVGVQVASAQERPATLSVSPETARLVDSLQRQEPTSIIDARKQALGRNFQLGDFAANNTWQYALTSDEAVPMGDSHDRASALSRSRVESYVTEKPRPEPAVNGYGDASDRGELPIGSEPVATTASGSEVDWPELGIGFAVGMAFLLGLILTVRVGRSHTVAH